MKKVACVRLGGSLVMVLLLAAFRAGAVDGALEETLQSLRHTRADPALAGGAATAALGAGPCGSVPAGATLRLSEDVSCSGTFWLDSGATLDLGGHVLTASIEASGSHATLENGTVVGTLDFTGCHDCSIERVHVRDGNDFVLLAGPRLLVTKSRFTGNDVAIDLYYAEGDVRIADSVFEDNAVGVNIAWPSGNVVSSSTFRRNRIGVNVWDEDGEGVNHNTVEDSLFEENQLGAVLYVRCEVSPCHEGNRFLRNRFRDNQGSGLLVEATTCEWPDTDCDGVEALARDNRFDRNGRDPIPPTSPDGLDQRNADDGLTVVGPAHATDGITIAANLALENADLGIDAAGVIDGAGNRAGGNGDSRQCVGVVCERVVAIDIKPGSEANALNPKARGVVAVAIFGEEGFDVRDVDLASLAFGPGGAPPAHGRGGHPADLDGDGRMDLVSHYRMPATGIARGDRQACVTGRTLEGAAFQGCDRIRTRP